MKAKVIKKYYDKAFGQQKDVDDIVEVDQQRLTILENAKVVERLIEIKSKEPKAE